jgi:hypothetical protein
MGLGDPGSEIRKKAYSGSRIRVQGQKGTGSRIRNTAWAAVELEPLGTAPQPARLW